MLEGKYIIEQVWCYCFIPDGLYSDTTHPFGVQNTYVVQTFNTQGKMF